MSLRLVSLVGWVVVLLAGCESSRGSRSARWSETLAPMPSPDAPIVQVIARVEGTEVIELLGLPETGHRTVFQSTLEILEPQAERGRQILLIGDDPVPPDSLLRESAATVAFSAPGPFSRPVTSSSEAGKPVIVYYVNAKAVYELRRRAE